MMKRKVLNGAALKTGYVVMNMDAMHFRWCLEILLLGRDRQQKSLGGFCYCGRYYSFVGAGVFVVFL